MTEDPTTPGACFDPALLDAVRAEVLAYGLRRATATSIARRAGVSRVTVYRRGGGIRQLVLEALTCVFRETVQAVADRVSAGTGRERVVAFVTSLTRELASEELISALVEHDPDLLLPYLVERLGRSQKIVIDQAREWIDAGQQDGSIRAGDPETMAFVLSQIMTPFVIGPHVAPDNSHEDLLNDEIHTAIEGYLRPSPSPAQE